MACSVAIPLSVAYVVVRHGVFGVKVAVRRGLQYLFARRALEALLAAPVGLLRYTLVRQRERTVVEIVTESRASLYWIGALGLSLRFRVPLLRPECGSCFDADAERCMHDGTDLKLSLPLSRLIAGKYRLDRLIGRGGMGSVYEARDVRLDREVAVKVMVGGVLGEAGALRRFRREGQAVARLDHPNIVAVYDFGELDGGAAYLVMERLRGSTLRAVMSRVGPFRLSDAADWFEPILDGLAAAHESGVVHRDLKPENVVGIRQASARLVVKILDFGLAKMQPGAAAAKASDTLTRSGIVLGTLAYMAPEQLRGREVDARADVYSAGVILAEMLTGARPCGDEAEGREDYRLPEDVDNRDALDGVLRRCLARTPEERFASAAELRAALIPSLRTNAEPSAGPIPTSP